MDIMAFVRIISGNRKRNSIMTIIGVIVMVVIINIYQKEINTKSV